MKWYGFIIAMGIVICVVGAYFAAKKRGIEGDIVIDIIVICLPLAIFGARLYYVIFNIIDGGEWTFARFFGFDNANGEFGLRGLAIYGGLIGATLGAVILWLWKNRKKNPANKRITFMQLLDLGFTFIILGQAVGRWGNFANQEAYGDAIKNSALQFFPIGVQIERLGNEWHYATFFYESVWNIVGFALLLWFYLGKRKSFDGFNFAAYCIYYGIGRAWIEGMRTDSLWLVPGKIRVSQLLSILLIVFGVAYIVAHCVMAKRANKKIFMFVPVNKLNDEYYGYEKTKLAHPMPDINTKKKRKGDGNVVVDNSGVAIKLDENVDQADSVVATDRRKSAEDTKQRHLSEPEEEYEDKWDD